MDIVLAGYQAQIFATDAPVARRGDALRIAVGFAVELGRCDQG
jgi:hypothetical protein